MDQRTADGLRDPRVGVRTAIRLLERLADRPLEGEPLRYWRLLIDDLADFLDAAGAAPRTVVQLRSDKPRDR